MSRYNRHVVSQAAGVRALIELLAASKQQVPTTLPAPWIEAGVDPPSSSLIDDFVRFSGGDPASYRGRVPPHLFCQWGLPAMLSVAAGLPYPATKVINAGSELRVLAPVPRGVRLTVASRLVALEQEPRRVRLVIEVITRRDSVELLRAQQRVVVPLRVNDTSKSEHQQPPKAPKERARVPEAARELVFRRLSRDAGADFALLTGDFNPIHWLGPYAKAVGFRDVILHGFASFALTFEALVGRVFSGDASRVARLDANFTRPLVLPAKVGVYVMGDQVYLGDALGGAAYLSGQFEVGG